MLAGVARGGSRWVVEEVDDSDGGVEGLVDIVRYCKLLEHLCKKPAVGNPSLKRPDIVPRETANRDPCSSVNSAGR